MYPEQTHLIGAFSAPCALGHSEHIFHETKRFRSTEHDVRGDHGAKFAGHGGIEAHLAAKRERTLIRLDRSSRIHHSSSQCFRIERTMRGILEQRC